MRVGIIDADLIGRARHRFPNLASMKISHWEKENGNETTLVTSYDKCELQKFDKIYLSKVFTDTVVPDWVLELDNITFGGTGFFYDNAEPLPDSIEHSMPDYHLYDSWVQQKLSSGGKRKDYEYYLDYSIGFTTRGCFRKCKFCVNKNYDRVNIHSPIEEFYDSSRKKICLLDDNILGSPEWKRIFEELIETGKPFQYKQGMDERILTDEKCEMLRRCKYDGDYIFAFDNIEDKDIIVEKAKMLRKYFTGKGQNIKFYVLCGFDASGSYDDEFWVKDIKDTFDRVFTLAEYNFKPYIMRYYKYKDSKYYGTYVNIACWCNQPSLFSNYSYRQFCQKDDERKSGGTHKSATWRYFEEINNDEFSQYIDVIPRHLNICTGS